ncbi:MAG TPA: hypothetical protein P5571_05175 [Candidatus Krumholzibacteria bacterium]|nr:hypothetical protein [Candidatus Krumholzibacteria bacterium]HRX50731.1 hypothetical protein [Candidatus Krumholzibacteria bacterium]
MLLELRISRLGLVDELALTCGPGLTMLTGETGAGKSMIAGALGLLRGGRVDKDVVRDGAEDGAVEAVFDLGEKPGLRRACAEAGVILADDALLVLRRELRREGRGRVIVNGRQSSQAVLEQLGPRLLAVQSQHQHLELARPGFARDVLDGTLGLESLRDETARRHRAWRDLTHRLERRRQEAAAAREQADLWRYQHDELATARLDPEEEASLAEALQLKLNAAAIRDAAATALALVDDGDAGVRRNLGRAVRALERQGGASARLDEACASLRDAESSVQDACLALDRFLDGLDLDPRGLDELQERKALYEELRRKYRLETPALLERQALLAERLSRHDAADRDLQDLEAETEAARTAAADAAAELRRARLAGRDAVAREAERIIRPLALKDLELEFAVEPRRDPAGPDVDGVPCRLDPDGADVITLLAVTNVGERLRPVAEIASGGERSRIHLGLTVLQRQDEEAPLLLLDEIDAGLGMDAARPVAHLLRDLAATAQLLCITHLPTMAAHGADHWRVAKSTARGRTRLTVARLEGEERVREVERLLGAVDAEEAAAGGRDYARTLLAEAG